MGSRSRRRRVQLALNAANLAASLALIAGALWCWLAERGWPAPAVVIRLYSPVLAALHSYDTEPVGVKALWALSAILSLLMVLTCVLFSFKVHLEEIAVILLGILFYLVVACTCFLIVGLAASLIRLLW